MMAIVVALRDEVASNLAKGRFKLTSQEDGTRLYRSGTYGDVAFVEGGIGRERIEKATRQAVEILRPNLIISAGFAGAVKRDLKTGDLLVCDRVWSVDGPQGGWLPESAQARSPDDEAVLDRLVTGLEGQFARGGCLSVPHVIHESSVKRWIGTSFPVSIIDMESFWVSRTAAQYGIAHMVVRAVLDPLDQSLPSFVGEAAANGGGGRWARAMRYALERPSQVGGLVRLAAQVRTARASLAAFLGGIISAEPASQAV